MFSRADPLYSPSHASRADEPGGLRVALIPGRAAESSSMVQGGADMAKAVLAGMLVLGLAACTGGAAKVARDGAPPEQLLAGGTRVTATIQDLLSSPQTSIRCRSISKSAPHRRIKTRGVEALAATWSSRPAPRSVFALTNSLKVSAR